MVGEEKPQEQELSSQERHRLADKLDAAGWALFFIWLGVALLVDVGYGIGLLGVAAIVLGEQVARRYYGLKIEGFWVVVGLLFAVGGLWELLGIEASLVPLLLIVVGLVLLFTKVLRR